MKILDGFLKLLKTNRNTFFAFLLTMITAYFVVDRVVEWVIICTTGVATSYWGPITYTIAFACTAFAYVFAIPSKLSKSDNTKIYFFYVYCIALYILFISMVIQSINYLSWFGLMCLPNYEAFFMNFSDLIRPAFTAISIYIPLITGYKLVTWLYVVINDPIFPNNYKDSILDFGGIDISNPPMETGPFSYEITLCKDRTTGKPVKILENRRFESTLIVGPSGTGKTALVIEPMIARDLEKKFFFDDKAKSLAFDALKKGLATLNCPYDKDYLSSHFTLSMLTPDEDKKDEYINHMGKMIYKKNSDGSIIYRNLGLTFITPDYASIEHVQEIANNYDIPVHLINPFDPDSPGLNPFALNIPPHVIALVINLVIRSLYSTQNVGDEMAYMQDTANQAIQNLVMLIKVMFPRLNNGLVPTLEDLLSCLNNFDYVESMCEELKKDPELVKEYNLQIGYFEQHFYKNSEGREKMQRYIHFASAQLDVLLRTASMKTILCNRYNNLDLGKVIENGEVVLVGTRADDIGYMPHVALGRFFMFFFLIGVESYAAKVGVRVPHFLYVDEFDSYAVPFLSDMFTVYRKYSVGTIFAIPTLSSIGGVHSPFAQAMLANCSTKLSFGNCTPEEYDWWQKEFGQRREWVIDTRYDKGDKNSDYSSNLGNVKWDWKDTMRVAKIQGLKFKGCIYKIKDKNGKNLVNYGSVDFLESKYKEHHSSKQYDFGKYNVGVVPDSKHDENKKFNPSDINWGGETDVDPIRTDTSDTVVFTEEDSGIKINKKKKE